MNTASPFYSPIKQNAQENTPHNSRCEIQIPNAETNKISQSVSYIDYLSLSDVQPVFHLHNALEQKKYDYEYESLYEHYSNITTNIWYKCDKSKYKECYFSLEKNTLTVYKYLPKLKREKKSKEKESSTIKSKHISDKEAYDGFNPICNIDFDLCSGKLIISKKENEFVIYILGFEKFFTFKIVNNNKELFNRLTKYLHLAIVTSKGYKFNIWGISLRKNFHRDYFIKENLFNKVARTGDILIFKGLECPSHLQRFYTGNEYDHVAMLYRHHGFLYVYEATGKDGCKDRLWNDFVYFWWNLLYDKITYRKLNINIEDTQEKEKVYKNIDNKFIEFLNMTKGKKYSLKLKPIVCGGKSTEYQKNREWNECKGYSCSSWVSGAYMNMGILNYEKDINEILPGKYSYNTQFELNKPFELGPETIIDFTM